MTTPPATPSIAARPRPRRLPLWKRLLFSAVVLALFILAGEIVARVRDGALVSTRNIRAKQVGLHKSAYPSTYDPLLGWTPRPNTAGQDNVWHTRVTIDAAGLRAHGPGPADAADAILALGDSFTFGDEVDDDQTWPAHLQQTLGRRVLNGGVFAYGMDQAVLRGEQLLDRFPARWVILSIIADDIRRNQLSYRHAGKPYFEVIDGNLTLRNVPVPPPAQRPDSLLVRALGYSHLANWLALRIAPRWWLSGRATVRVHTQGVEVGRLLLDRLDLACRQRGARLLLVVQWLPGAPGLDDLTSPLIEHARDRGIATLDLSQPLRDLVAGDDAMRRQLFRGHMSPEGNRWVAQRIAQAIRDIESAPPPPASDGPAPPAP